MSQAFETFPWDQIHGFFNGINIQGLPDGVSLQDLKQPQAHMVQKLYFFFLQVDKSFANIGTLKYPFLLGVWFL